MAAGGKRLRQVFFLNLIVVAQASFVRLGFLGTTGEVERFGQEVAGIRAECMALQEGRMKAKVDKINAFMAPEKGPIVYA
jgi:hypothetical protein